MPVSLYMMGDFVFFRVLYINVFSCSDHLECISFAYNLIKMAARKG